MDPVKDPTPTGDPNAEPTGDKVFTQADVDAAVAKGVEPYKAGQDEYERLAENPRFHSFIDEENKRIQLGDEEYEKLYGGKDTDAEGDDGEDKSLEGLTDREKQLTRELDELKKSVANIHVSNEENAVKDEYKTVASDKENYPLFDKTIKVGDTETPVRELMAQELDKAAKAGKSMTIAQAYREVTYDHQRELGRKDAEEVAAKKRDAARVGMPVASPGRSSEGSKKFNNAREAVEATLDELGI